MAIHYYPKRKAGTHVTIYYLTNEPGTCKEEEW